MPYTTNKTYNTYAPAPTRPPPPAECEPPGLGCDPDKEVWLGFPNECEFLGNLAVIEGLVQVIDALHYFAHPPLHGDVEFENFDF